MKLQMAQSAPHTAAVPSWSLMTWRWRLPSYVALPALCILAAVAVGLMSEEARVLRLLSAPQHLPPPHIPFAVERPEVDLIAKRLGGLTSSFLVVEGGDRVGKTVAVAMAVSRLSSTTAVVTANSEAADTLDTLLRRMLRLTGRTHLHWPLALIPNPLRTDSVATVLLHRPHTTQQVSGRSSCPRCPRVHHPSD